jgi:hypothetical protein
MLTLGWNPGAVILENASNVTFSVPPSSNQNNVWSQKIVKDFGWLRSGVPSPNFEINQCDATAIAPGDSDKKGGSLVEENDDEDEL